MRVVHSTVGTLVHWLYYIVITPTSELAIQIGASFTDYGKFTGIRNTVIFGGVKQGAQTEMLRKGVDILVATPGRLLDLIDQGFIRSTNRRIFCTG